MVSGEEFKYLYKNIKNYINELIVHLQIFDDDFIYLENEIKNYLNIDSIMYLSRDIFDYFENQNIQILNSSIYFLENNHLTDDSDIEDVNMHIHFQLINKIIEFSKNDMMIYELINELIKINKYHNIFIQNLEDYEMLKIELMFEESL